MRPENERALREGFQRRAEEQRRRFAGQVAHADRLAAAFGFGEVVAIFAGETPDQNQTRRYMTGLLPLAAIPPAIAGAAAGVPGAVPLLGILPFVTGGWFFVTLMRGREARRCIWFYAYPQGFTIFERPEVDAVPVRWSDVTSVDDVWTDVPNFDGDSHRQHTAYDLHLANGASLRIARNYENVLDPYSGVGPLLSTLSPSVLGKTIPGFPTIDKIITVYARHCDERS